MSRVQVQMWAACTFGVAKSPSSPARAPNGLHSPGASELVLVPSSCRYQRALSTLQKEAFWLMETDSYPLFKRQQVVAVRSWLTCGCVYVRGWVSIRGGVCACV